MMRATAIVSALAGLALASGAQAATRLKVGSPAPPIRVAKWIKGQPVRAFQKNQVYVVEMWATWCGPCRESIPHLTEMAKKLRGKVTFAGVSVMEQGKPAEYIPAVTRFVKDMGGKMDYNVAVDANDGFMATHWLQASGSEGIPTAFIVGRDSRVAWFGHPLEMEPVLNRVVAGTFNSGAYAAQRDKAEAQARSQMQLLSKAASLMQAGKTREAAAELDHVIAAHPDQEKSLGLIKYSLLLKSNEKAAYAYGRKLADGALRNEPQMLNNLSWQIVQDGTPLKTPDYDAAIAIASRAVEATHSQDSAILDTLAYGYYRKGNLGKAIETEELALRNVDKVKMQPERTRKLLTAHLELFKQKQGRR